MRFAELWGSSEGGRNLKTTIPFLLLFVAFFSAPLLGEGMLPHERDALWREAEQQLKNHPRLVYHDGSDGLPNYPGFITTNEYLHWTMRPPPGKGDMLVGFSNTINFNVVATRQNSTFINADQNIEPLVAMMSFWKPLFLASKSPGEFIGAIGGLKVEKGESADSVFRRIYAREPMNSSAMAEVDRKLSKLVNEGKITAFDHKFCDAVLRDQWSPPIGIPQEISSLLGMLGFDVFRSSPTVPVFRKSETGGNIKVWLAQAYWFPAQNNALNDLWNNSRREPPFMSELSKTNAAEAEAQLKRVSFLEEAGFMNVKKMLADGGDHYALSQMQDPKLWKAVAKTAKAREAKLTDVYLSNIPSIAKQETENLDALLAEGISKSPHDGQIAIYEAHISAPHIFETQLFEPGKPLRRKILVRSTTGSLTTGCFRGLTKLRPDNHPNK